jgi:ribonuclease R
MARIPSKADLLAWIAGHPGESDRRGIARAFGLKGGERVELKRLLRELEDEGALDRRRRGSRKGADLPPVGVVVVTGLTPEGEPLARALDWAGAGEGPRILCLARRGDPALGPGDRVLARLARVDAETHDYEARTIRRIGERPRRILGVFRRTAEGGRIVPIDKGAAREWLVGPGATGGARDGELVEAELASAAPRLGLPRARVIDRLGDPLAPKSVSLIAIHEHAIPDAFPDDALAEAEAAPAAVDPAGREDLRAIPFVTIDPEDARDHDDAVWAGPDPDPGNPGGHVLWIGIADVAAYVRPGSALDREARRRGNSTYFPDRVVPMLPDRLSGDLCSLIEGADRPCIAVRIAIGPDGARRSHRFVRGLLRSAARLTYAEVQAAAEGRASARAAPLVQGVIAPLYAAHAALARARARRQPLDLDLPERCIRLSPEGRVVSVGFAERLAAHRLIEEFMVAANAAAAEELIARRSPLLFRVHEEPPPEKLEALRAVAEAAGFALAKGQVLTTAHLNRLLAEAARTDAAEIVHLATLRALPQAFYSPRNLGHFGLALPAYTHFTSPIRRYADLIVHRALIAAHGWGDDGLSAGDVERLEDTAERISEAERRSLAAERDTADRYLAAYLSDRVGAEFGGRITGVARFGAFVKLDGTGADGLIPVRSLGREAFHFDAASQTLRGAKSGIALALGQRVRVRLAEAVPVTGGLMFELVAVEGAAPARAPVARRRGGGAKRARAVRPPRRQ